jgi:hypothetical protein
MFFSGISDVISQLNGGNLEELSDQDVSGMIDNALPRNSSYRIKCVSVEFPALTLPFQTETTVGRIILMSTRDSILSRLRHIRLLRKRTVCIRISNDQRFTDISKSSDVCRAARREIDRLQRLRSNR